MKLGEERGVLFPILKGLNIKNNIDTMMFLMSFIFHDVIKYGFIATMCCLFLLMKNIICSIITFSVINVQHIVKKITPLSKKMKTGISKVEMPVLMYMNVVLFKVNSHVLGNGRNIRLYK